MTTEEDSPTTGRAPRISFTASRIFTFFTQVQVLLYRLTGGIIGGRMGKNTVLLLTTTGRKSGKQRTKPLFYLADGDRLALVASSGGSDLPPAWWVNLQARPVAEVQIGRRKLRVEARQATEEEQRRLWPQHLARYPAYGDYQKRTTRKIPIVLLTPL